MWHLATEMAPPIQPRRWSVRHAGGWQAITGHCEWMLVPPKPNLFAA
jgi:hypothetical protein